MCKKLVLIDGLSILNRAFYGVPDLTNQQGLHTNAVYGFLNILFKIMEEEQPEYLCVAFDAFAKTFRHEIYTEYKGTRKGMPEELKQQVPVMKQVLSSMNIVAMEYPGYEADDLLGTLAKKAQQDGLEVSLVSGDRDLLQIATDSIKIRIPKTVKGKTEIIDYYERDVEAQYGVTPTQFIELKALMGDTSDNIPGVPKVGEKTAIWLMQTYGSLEGIYEHLEEISKNSIRESLRENKALADLSKVLATIKTDCPINLCYEDAKLQNIYTEEFYHQLKQLEFKNLLQRFEQQEHEQGTTLPSLKQVFSYEELWKELSLYAKKEASGEKGILGFFPLIHHKSLDSLAIAVGEDFLAFMDCREKSGLEDFMEKLTDSFILSTYDIKPQYAFLNQEGLENYFDCLIGAYLLNPNKSDIDIESIASEYLSMVIPGKKELFGKDTVEAICNSDPEKKKQYCGMAAYVCRNAMGCISKSLKEAAMDKLFYEIEMPLSVVLYSMEEAGIIAKKQELADYSEFLGKQLTRLEADIYEQAGMPFNIQSPKQLGEVLFERLQLKGGKKTKTGYSTAADVLEKLAPESKIVRDILEYRGLAKLKSTYADGLVNYIDEDGRIHTHFNQTITATGRISSTEPNLQNIPMRTELGRKIRQVFVPEENYVFIDADYSQIELRVLAHMSGDEQLIESYRTALDIHRITASKVFHVPLDEVTDLQRRNAKAVNFGIVYGISSFGLSQDLSITTKEAASYIEQYFATYPKVKEFLDGCVEDGKTKGYTTTLFGRRRPIPELASSNFMQRSFGERIAMNSPVQGTAADIIKIAMILVWKELKNRGLKSRLILQVHDELLIESYGEEADQVQELLEDCMKRAATLAVELEVDVHRGSTWYEAK